MAVLVYERISDRCDETRHGNVHRLPSSTCQSGIVMTMPASIQSARFGSPRNASHVLLLAVVIAMTPGLARGQASSGQPETMPPSSTTTHDGSADNQSTSIQRRSDQAGNGPCRLRVPDTLPPSPSDAKNLVTTSAALPYTPLTSRCKFNLFLRTTYSPYTFLSAAFQATLDQAQGQWPHYGGGMQGWGKRFGATLADTESRRFIQTFALSTVLHQDPRYFPAHKRRLILRALYATTRVVVTKSDKGENTFNTSELLGALFTSSLQNAYYPSEDRTFGDTLNRFGGALSSDAVGNLLREFTPDMKRLFRKHAPEKIKKIEEKLPIPPEDRP